VGDRAHVILGVVPEHKRPTGRDYPRGLNAGVLLLHVGRLRQPDRLKAYWTAVVSIVKEGGYGSLRLGNWSKGLIYYDQVCLECMLALFFMLIRLNPRYPQYS